VRKRLIGTHLNITHMHENPGEFPGSSSGHSTFRAGSLNSNLFVCCSAGWCKRELLLSYSPPANCLPSSFSFFCRTCSQAHTTRTKTVRQANIHRLELASSVLSKLLILFYTCPKVVSEQHWSASPLPRGNLESGQADDVVWGKSISTALWYFIHVKQQGYKYASFLAKAAVFGKGAANSRHTASQPLLQSIKHAWNVVVSSSPLYLFVLFQLWVSFFFSYVSIKMKLHQIRMEAGCGKFPAHMYPSVCINTAGCAWHWASNHSA
jgi:hypothetical protein